MISKQIRQKAIGMRKRGFSYEAISKKLHISKSISYVWLKDVELSEIAKLRIAESQTLGRSEGRRKILGNILKRNQDIFSKVEKKVIQMKISGDLRRLLCALLYRSEGEKTGVKIAFTNSDPAMIMLFLRLFRGSFAIREENIKAVLHLHPYHNIKKQLKFWSGVTGIPKYRISVYNKNNSGKNLRKNYPGCISVRYNDVRIFRELEYYFKVFTRKGGGFV